MNLRLVLAFLIAFFIEIKVKAAEEIHYSPAKCSPFTSGCQAANLTRVVKKLEWSDSLMTRVVLMYPGAQLLFGPDNHIVLVNGEVFLDFDGSLDIRTEHVEVHGESGLLWLSRNSKRTELVAYENEYALKLRGKSERIALREGYKLSLFGLDSSGRTIATFPSIWTRAGDLETLLLSDHSHLATIRSRLERAVERLKGAADQESADKLAIIERSIASQREEARRLAQVKREQERAERELIDLVRRKNYLDF